MTSAVIDASVLVKWFVSEVHSDLALRLRGEGWTLLAPDLLVSEVGSVLLHKVRRGTLDADDAERMMESLSKSGIELASGSSLGVDAIRLGRRSHPSFYDCTYLALALRESCQCVTADRRFYDAFAGAFPETMLWVADIPERAPANKGP